MNFLPYMGQRPIFRDDKCFLPLQAADLYAWQVRRHYARNRVLWAPPTDVMRMLSGIGMTIERHVDERQLIDFRAYMDRNSPTLLAANPAAELIPYKGTKKAQKRERAKLRQSRARDASPERSS